MAGCLGPRLTSAGGYAGRLHDDRPAPRRKVGPARAMQRLPAPWLTFVAPCTASADLHRGAGLIVCQLDGAGRRIVTLVELAGRRHRATPMPRNCRRSKAAAVRLHDATVERTRGKYYASSRGCLQQWTATGLLSSDAQMRYLILAPVSLHAMRKRRTRSHQLVPDHSSPQSWTTWPGVASRYWRIGGW